MTAIQEPVAVPPVAVSRREQIDRVVAAVQAKTAVPAVEAPVVTGAAAAVDAAAPATEGTVEVPAVGEAAVEEALAVEDDSPSKRARALAALTRRERQLKAEHERLQAQQAEAAKYRDELAAVKADPIKYLEAQNPDFYSDYTQRKLNDGQPSPMEEIRRVRDELSQLKEQNEALQKQAQQAHNDRIIMEARKELQTILADDAYEYTRAYNAEDEVFSLIGMHYQRTGEDLPLADAARMIEQELETRLERLTKSKKFQSKSGAPKPAPETAQKPAAPRTLTNGHTGTVQSVDFTKMERSDKIKYLAAKIQAGAT